MIVLILIEIAYIETSALNASNVDKAFKNLVTEIYKISKAQQSTQATTAMIAPGGKSTTNFITSQDGLIDNSNSVFQKGDSKGGVKLSVLKHSKSEIEK
jgi:hypothetical protein